MKISVIVPAYNCAQYVESCIDSLLEQKGAELEIIVVNDGSKDNLIEVVSKYGDVIDLITIENGGVANARNVGLSHATGDFVMFVDADDRLRPDCIESIIKKMGDADIVRFGYVLLFGDGHTQKPLNYFLKDEVITKSEFKKKIYPNYINGIKLNSICMTLFRRSVVEGLRFRKDLVTAEGASFSLNAYTKAEKVLILSEEYYLYYQSNEGLTGNGLSIWKKYKSNFILSGEIIKMLPTWGMNSPIWYLRAAFRPVVLTFDKITRMRKSKNTD